MKTTRVMSLVAATVFALGLAGSAVAQTPATPTPAPAPAQTTPPAKGGDMEKKDKKADKQHSKKKHAAAKKTEGDVKATTPETKAPEVKK